MPKNPTYLVPVIDHYRDVNAKFPRPDTLPPPGDPVLTAAILLVYHDALRDDLGLMGATFERADEIAGLKEEVS
jgi:hypothetical protein